MAKILIVDDEQDVLDFCGRILKREGFAVFTAANGKDALSLVKTEHPDLILLDILMPEMDGGDVAKKLSLSQDTKNIPVIFLSGLIQKADEGNVKGRVFISKNSSKEEILKVIKKALGIKS